jgi:hypothetical protein
VNVAHNMGIIEGYPDHTFRAGNPVTAAEAIAMLTRAMQNEEAVYGVWPMNYMIWAYSSGLLEDLNLFANLPITRGEMAMLTVNALGLERGYVPEEEDFDLAPLADAFVVEGALVEAVDPEGAEEITCRVGGASETYGLASVVTLVGASDFQGLLNREVMLVFADDLVVYIETVESGAVVTGVFAEQKTEDDEDYLVLEDGTEVLYTGDTVFEVNASTEGFGAGDLMPGAELTIVMDAGEAAYVKALQEDIPNVFIAAGGVEILDEPEDGVIGRITVTDGVDDVTLDVTEDTAISLNGQTAGLEDLADHDIVYAATYACEGETAIALAVIHDRVTGTVEEVTKVYTSPTEYYTVVTVEYQEDRFRDLTLDEAIEDQAFLPDTEYFFNLNREDEVRYSGEVGPAPDTYTIVKVVGYEDRIDVDRVIVDRAGTTATYSTEDPGLGAGSIGLVGELTIDGETGYVTFESYPLAADYYKIHALDAADGTMTIGLGGTYWFIDNPALVVYDHDDTAPNGVGAYIGMAGLEVGEYVQVDDPTDAHWMLRFGDEHP